MPFILKRLLRIKLPKIIINISFNNSLLIYTFFATSHNPYRSDLCDFGWRVLNYKTKIYRRHGNKE